MDTLKFNCIIYGIYLKVEEGKYRMWNVFFYTEREAKKFCEDEKLGDYYLAPVNLCTYE